MTVFATPLLDNFNRANEAPVGAGGSNWSPNAGSTPADPDASGGFASYKPLLLTSNAAGIFGGATRSTSAWIGSGVLGEVELYATLAVAIPTSAVSPTTWSLYARVNNVGNATTFTAYRFDINNSGAASIRRAVGSSASTSLASSSPGIPNLNDKMGMRVYTLLGAPMIEGWLFTSGLWRRVVATIDMSGIVPSTGYLGLGLTNASSTPQSESFDDFSGGTISAPAYSINSDSAPGFTSGLRDRLAERGSLQQAGKLGGPAFARRDRLAEKGWIMPGRVPAGTGNVAGHGGNLIVL